MKLRHLLRQARLAAAVCAAVFVAQSWAYGAPQAVAGKPQAASDFKFRIAGTIVNALTGEPLARARVALSISGTAQQQIARVITSEDGRFAFTRLAAGKYSLQGAKRGFVAAAYEQHEQFWTGIVTGAGLDTENLRLQLTPLAFLSGKVLDESGEPVRQASVALYRRMTTAGLSRTFVAGRDSTDDLGYFEFPAMPPGDYFVAASGKPWYAVHARLAAQEGAPAAADVSKTLDVTYPTTYYDGAAESNDATPITAKAGDRLRIDLHLNPVPSLHLIFRPAEGTQGFGVPSFQKRVFDATETLQSVESQWVAPGVWEVSGVPAGRYTVTGRGQGNQHSGEFSLRQDGQELDLSRGEASAQVVVRIKTPPDETAPAQLFVGLRNAERRFVANQTADSSGVVTFQNLAPGHYTIVIGSQAKAYSVNRITSQAGESSGGEVEIAAGASLDLTAYLYAGVVDIEGVVKRGDKRASGIMVALVPKDPEAHLELFRRDQSDLDGSFIVRGVIPGTYTIIAVEDAWGFPWLEHGVLARYLPKGQTVNVTERMKRSVYLPEPLQVQPR